MRRQVDLMVSPRWLANFFGVTIAPDRGAESRFDATAVGVDGNGQFRIPIVADLPEGVTEVEGVYSYAQLVPVHPDKLAAVRRVIDPRAEVVTVIFPGDGTVKPWTVR